MSRPLRPSPREVTVALLVVLALVASETATVAAGTGRGYAGLDLPIPVDATAGSPEANLLPNVGLSWVRGWTPDGGPGRYVRPDGPGRWTLGGTDPTTGERITEAFSRQETTIPAGTPVAASIVVEHRGGSFDAELLFRTREARVRPDTVVERLSPDVVRLSASLPASDRDVRLRTVHLDRVRGDFESLTLSSAMLEPTSEASARFVPAVAAVPPWHGVAYGSAVVALVVLVGVVVQRVGVGPARAGLAVALGAVLAASSAALAREAWVEGIVRAAGPFSHPNVAAAVVIAWAVACLAAVPRRWRAVAVPLVGALAVIGLATTGSRTGLATVAVAVAIVVVRFAPRQRRRWRLALAVSAAVVMAALAFWIADRRELGDGGWTSGLVARAQAWSTSFALVADHPWAGVGFGGFAAAYDLAEPNTLGPRYRNAHAHSVPLQLAVEEGLPFLLALTAGAGIVARRLIRRRRWDRLTVALVLAVPCLADLPTVHAAFLVPAAIALRMPREDGEGRPPEPATVGPA